MNEAFKQIGIHEANGMIAKGEAAVIDIRDPQSYSAGHIANAVLIDEQNIDEYLKNSDKHKPLICYCYHGNNSQSAAEFFVEKGFKEVYSIIGGYEEYRLVYPRVILKGQS